jgi:long-chain fatty acid transport protein
MLPMLRKLACAAALAELLGADNAAAAGFGLIEQGAGGMGNAYAGAAATAEDASTIFFNPAGLTRLEGSQFALAGHVILIDVEFANDGNSASPTPPQSPLGGNGGDAGGTAVVPNAYFSAPVGDRWVLGIGVNAPFGLGTDYDASWVGRYQGLKTEVLALNVNPSVAYEINSTLSVGFGLSYQTFDTKLTNAQVVVPGVLEGPSTLELDDGGFGWNAGVLIQAAPGTRIGVSYRSAIDYSLEGNVRVTDASGSVAFLDASASADFTVPDMLSVSVVHAINDNLDLLADITFTQWSKLDRVPISASGIGVLDTIMFEFEDAFRYSLGFNYQWSERFVGKIGVALDESPVNDYNRAVRLPDSDAIWVSLGGSYKVGRSGKLDFGYSHLFTTSDPAIDQDRDNAALFGVVSGTYETSMDKISFQYSLSF